LIETSEKYFSFIGKLSAEITYQRQISNCPSVYMPAGVVVGDKKYVFGLMAAQ
jgi:hypothetical protein